MNILFQTRTMILLNSLTSDWIISITATQKNNVCNLEFEVHCLQAMKIVYLQDVLSP